MNRPKWTPRNDRDREDLARMDILAEQAARAEQAVLDHAKDMLDRKIPGEEVAKRARMSKATIYRRVGPSSVSTGG